MQKCNKIQEFPDRKLLHEQAAAWVARMDDAPLTQDELRDFRKWIGQSETHKKIILDTAKVWDGMDVLIGQYDWSGINAGSENRKLLFDFRIKVLTASVLLMSIFTFYYSQVGQESIFGPDVEDRAITVQYYETPVGGIDVVHLSDGSVVSLNTATRVEIDISENRRHIELHQGEAYFEVAKNESAPFIVTANSTALHALGTAFNVQKLADGIEVTVTEGLVEVDKSEKDDEITKSDTGVEPVVLRAGQVAKVSPLGLDEIITTSADGFSRKLLWRQNMLAFDGDTLQHVVDEFSRYSNIEISIADAETAAIRVGGYFRSDDIDGLLTSLEENFSISVFRTAANRFELKREKR